ncbi:MAG: tripartite tricarboxylate transporter TctB family protein [Alphaproteobacteria bacterium]|nr:tripartite tricarboxylate transporter TctB family protein [Alphaproteobacteria bacterium]
MAGGRAFGETLIGAGLVLLAGLVILETAGAPASPLYARVGPQAFPYAVGGCLLLLGLALVLRGLHGGGRDGVAEPDLAPVRARPVLWLLAGLALNVALIGEAGFILASTVLFLCVARAFGSERPLRDGLAGLALAGVAYAGFAGLLGISLGRGLIERLF